MAMYSEATPGRMARDISPAWSDISELTILSRCPSPVLEGVPRAASPTLTDISELTAFSRSPSPVPDYAAFLGGCEHQALGVSSIPLQQIRGADGRFVAQSVKRTRSPSVERSIKKTARSKESKLHTSRKRKNAESTPQTPESMSPVPWVVGEGGFGTLEVLPREIRQYIWGFAFDIDNPVTVKECCGPDATKRERDACRKHGIGTTFRAGRFKILQLSKAIKDEASWVVFNQGSVLLDVNKAVAPYLDGYRSNSLRHIPGFVQHDKRKAAMWTMAARFRFINIRVAEHVLQYGSPAVFTGQLLGITTLLCKTWDQPLLYDVLVLPVLKSVHVNVGSIFHQMLPFNMNSQAEERYGELLDWLFVHSPCAEPNFDKIAAESQHNLQRMLSIVGKHCGRSQWKIAAMTQLNEKDEGGTEALRAFQIGCAKNGVVFEHTK